MKKLTLTLSLTAALLAAAPAAQAAPPLISETTFSQVTTASATLEATVDPQGKATTYHFEFGAADCSANPCTALPNGKAIPGASAPVTVAANLEGLQPATAYHFRLIAEHASEAPVKGPDRTLTTFALPQAFESCPNEEFRSGALSPPDHPSSALPDCRAYEQASPVDKNGIDIRGRVSLSKAAAEGDAVTFGAPGGLPGAEGSQDLPTFLATRSGSSWSTQGLFPPQSYGQSVFLIGWTPDLSTTYTSASRLGPPEDAALLARQSTGGIAEAVPYGTGFLNAAAQGSVFGFAGTAGEGDEVYFESNAKLAPAALAGSPNVYVWDRASGALRLAGALNGASPEGKAPTQGAFAGSYDWIAGTDATSLARGGANARYYTQEAHAISSEGSLFFTSAGVGRVYLRRNPTEPQSALDPEGHCTEATRACTVAISASEKENGQGEGGHDAAGSAPAAFLAASADGSKALFTSSEKLTDDATTGSEPPAASIGRADLAEPPEPDTSFCPGRIAKGVAVDGSHLYWANPAAGTISRSGLQCEDPEVLVAGAANPQYVAVDSEHLYWTNAGAGKDGEGTIGRAKLAAGGAEEVEEDFIEGASNPQGIAVGDCAEGGQCLYWSNAGETDPTRTIGRGTVEGEEADQSFIAVGNGTRNLPRGLAVNATHIYVTVDGPLSLAEPQGLSYLFRYDLDGELASRLLRFDSEHPGLAGVRGIALDSSHVYWARQGQDTIGRCNLDLEAASCDREFIKDAGHPLGLAADGSHLYWAVNGEVSPNPGNDLYLYSEEPDAEGHHLADLVPDTGDAHGADVKGLLGASEDGSAVYLVANGVPAGTVGSPNANGEVASPGDCRGSATGITYTFSGQCNLYLWREGHPLAFIARLDGADALDWLPRGGFGNEEEKSARVAPDGSAAIFFSRRRLSAYDNRGRLELYRYDAASGALGCLSCSPTGQPPSQVGGPDLGSIDFYELRPPEFTYTLSRNLSADGSRAFFETTEALVGADTNGRGGCPIETRGPNSSFQSCQDVYEWEAPETGSCSTQSPAYVAQSGGCIYLLSSGRSPRASFFADASADGSDAFVLSAEAGLVRQDGDELYDLFDTRAFGGLAAQNQAAPVPCEGEGCKPAASPPPPQGSDPVTPQFVGPPDPTRPRCKKGQRLKGGHCVRKKHRRHGGPKHPRHHNRGGNQ